MRSTGYITAVILVLITIDVVSDRTLIFGNDRFLSLTMKVNRTASEMDEDNSISDVLLTDDDDAEEDEDSLAEVAEAKNEAGDLTAFTYENLGCTNYSHMAPCGNTKCFYPLVSDPTVGYIVSKLHTSRFRAGERNYNLGVHLERDYGIRRLPLSLPEKLVNVTSELGECLQSKRERSNAKEDHNIPDFEPTQGKTRVRPLKLMIQKHGVATTDETVVFKCDRKLGESLRSNHSSTESYWNGVVNFTSYLHTLRRESALAKHVLHRESYLLRDFQVMVDQQGQFHYIDIGHHAPGGADPSLLPRKSTSITGMHQKCFRAFDSFDEAAVEQAQRRWNATGASS